MLFISRFRINNKMEQQCFKIRVCVFAYMPVRIKLREVHNNTMQ